MRIMLVVAPSQDYSVLNLSAKTRNTDPPYGAMYIASALIEDKHDVRIECGDLEVLDGPALVERIRLFKPDVVGISAIISTSYKYVKDVSFAVKEAFPDIKIIVGGGLGAAGDVVLRNTGVDVVVLGEGDVTVKEVVERFSRNETLEGVAGILFKDRGEVIRTPERRVILSMDTLKYPAFHLVDMKRYSIDVRKYVTTFRNFKDPDKRLFEKKRSLSMIRMPLSRGCIARCTFCYRLNTGHRHFSLSYIGDYLEYMINTFGVNVFSFGDECFAPNKAWNMKFIEELKRRKIDIMFQILGMRVDTVDYDILRAYKEAGCFMIEYGIESGSQKMLDMMEKRVKVQQNIDVALWTRKAGIFMSPNLVLGMPGETESTIKENIAFLKKISYGPTCYQYSFAFAVPGSPLYEYAKLTGLLKDEDKYLSAISTANILNHISKGSFINFTSEPLAALKQWPDMIKDALLKHYSKNGFMYLINKYLRLETVLHTFMTRGLKVTVSMILVRLFNKKKKVPGADIALDQDTIKKVAFAYSLINSADPVGLRAINKSLCVQGDAPQTAQDMVR